MSDEAGGTDDPPSADRLGTNRPGNRPPAGAIALVGVAFVALIVGLIVWLVSRDDSTTSAPSASSSASTSVSTTASSTVASSTTLVDPTTTAPMTTSTTIPTTTPTTTAPSTVAPSTTVPPTTTATLPTEPGGPVWLATFEVAPGDTITMSRVDQAGGLAAYDGETNDGLRCVAVVPDGETSWQEWCGGVRQAARFVAMHDDRPWLVEVGPFAGEVALLVQPPDWTLPSNGCSERFTTLASTALTFDGRVSPAVTNWIVCVPGEAFVGYSSVLLQPGPADGGGALLVESDGGWTSFGPGTSYGCADLSDGVDRCELFGVDDDLFGALLPVPSPDTIGPTDAVTGVTDRTAEVESWIGDETDPAVVDSIVVERLFDPDAEVPAIVRRADRLGFGGVNLLVVQIPQLDDSIATETWAVWIGALEETAGVRAWSWATCARGVTDDGLCV